MLIPDLYEYRVGHPPDPYGSGVALSRYGMVAVGMLQRSDVLRAVGWLGDRVPSAGATPEPCIDRLVEACEQHLEFSDFTRGYHDCELCTAPQDFGAASVRWRGREVLVPGRGHFLIGLAVPRLVSRRTPVPLRDRRAVYMCPVLIVHYIIDHRYRPPDEFVKAVVEGRFLNSDDLVVSDPLSDEEL